jgi:D-3-phosphoglycerate dehydrogenase
MPASKKATVDAKSGPAATSRAVAKTDRFRVLVADTLSPEGIKILESEPQLAVEVKTGLTPSQLAEVIGSYDAMIVRSASKVTAEVIAKADRLRVIGRAGVGLDNVDLEAATKRGIIAMNVPAGNTISAAEHTFSLMLSIARRIPQADASMRNGKWERSKFVGTELFGKTLGVVGLGKIGSELAKRARAFGMRVIAFDPFLSEAQAQQLEVQSVPLAQVFKDADFISVHTPLTPQTRHMVGEKELASMKKSAYLVNCARGGIIDEAALHKALTGGTIAGAALDVFEQEPADPTNALFKTPNCVVTPHLGASTEEAQLNVAIEIARQVADCLLGRGIRNAANMPSIDPRTLQVLQPYVTLGEKLGGLASQLLGGQVSEVRITYVGEMTGHDTAPITLAILKGLLQPMVGENVNYVNASFLASERGIKVVEAKSSRAEEFANMVAVEVLCDGQSLAVQGTLSARREPRLVRIDRFAVEVAPVGYLLIIKNKDLPGLIGQVGSLLGDAGVNIAGMSNGRETPGGDAITVVNVDDPIPAKVLEQLKTLKSVLDAKLIAL